MKWRGRKQSVNLEDRRGGGGGRARIGFPMGSGGGRMGRRAGIGGIGLVAVVLVSLFFGVDPRQFIDGIQAPSGGGSSVRTASDTDPMRNFVAVVLANTEDVWHRLFKNRLDKPYREPKLVLFSGGVQSACGSAGSAVGPFYCPGDQKIYLDLSFFRTLRDRFKAAGDFAQAYVIAHEVGHHIQTLLGISQRVHESRSRMPKAQANALSVRLELQADCLAGLWANHADKTKGILEEGDIDEALRAASAIGDDTLQRQAQGRVVPDSFTHGTSAQRQHWFRRGFRIGSLQACYTFDARAY